LKTAEEKPDDKDDSSALRYKTAEDKLDDKDDSSALRYKTSRSECNRRLLLSLKIY
jgi:hypothetical protein